MIRSTVIALAASLIAMSPAHADAADTHSRAVRTSDLNLASDTGRILLDQRIRRAARSLCRDPGSLRGHLRNSEAQCIDKAIADTRPRVALLLAAARSGIAMGDRKLKLSAN